MILLDKQITKALISLCQCAGWSGPVLCPSYPRRQVFSRRGPYNSSTKRGNILTRIWSHSMPIILKYFCSGVIGILWIRNVFNFRLPIWSISGRNKNNSSNLYPPMKGYFRETCKSQNKNPNYWYLDP